MAAQLQAPSVTGDFQLASNSCGAMLAPGTNCTLQIAFAPTATGSRDGGDDFASQRGGRQRDGDAEWHGSSAGGVDVEPDVAKFSGDDPGGELGR